MGRPINDRYFGSRNVGNIGGKSVTAVALGTAGSGYSQGLTATVGAPQLAGDGAVTATVSVQVNTSTGAILGYTVTNPKANGGYTSAPTTTLAKPATVTPTGTGTSSQSTIVVSTVTGIYVGMAVSGTNVGGGATVQSINAATSTVTVTVANGGAVTGTITFQDSGSSGVPGTATIAYLGESNQDPSAALAFTAITVGTTARANSDVIKQVGSRRYKIKNTDGTAKCKLVAATPTVAGTASLTATDTGSGTYYVTKLTEHKARLTQYGSGPWQFANNTSVKWIVGTAVANKSVSLASV